MTGSTQLSEKLAEDSGYYLCGEALLEKGTTDFQAYEVWSNRNYGNILRLDGIIQLTERDEFTYHENMVHIAGLTHPGIRSALIIGGGDGGTLEEVLKYPSLERVVMVEIDDKVIDIARKHFASVTRGAFDDRRLELKVMDGMQYVREDARKAGEQFDLIVLDLNDPVGPSAALYAESFFADCKAILAKDGLFTLHLGPALYQPERVAELNQRLARVFRHVAPYAAYIPFYGSLWSMAAASDALNPAALSAEEVDRRIAAHRLPDLQYVNGESFRAVLAQPNFLRKILATTNRKGVAA